MTCTLPRRSSLDVTMTSKKRWNDCRESPGPLLPGASTKVSKPTTQTWIAKRFVRARFTELATMWGATWVCQGARVDGLLQTGFDRAVQGPTTPVASAAWRASESRPACGVLTLGPNIAVSLPSELKMDREHEPKSFFPSLSILSVHVFGKPPDTSSWLTDVDRKFP